MGDNAKALYLQNNTCWQFFFVGFFDGTTRNSCQSIYYLMEVKRCQEF